MPALHFSYSHTKGWSWCDLSRWSKTLHSWSSVNEYTPEEKQDLKKKTPPFRLSTSWSYASMHPSSCHVHHISPDSYETLLSMIAVGSSAITCSLKTANHLWESQMLQMRRMLQRCYMFENADVRHTWCTGSMEGCHTSRNMHLATAAMSREAKKCSHKGATQSLCCTGNFSLAKNAQEEAETETWSFN